MSARVFVITFKSGGKILATVDVARGCEPIQIGRSHSCVLRAPSDDHSVSGKHARLFWKGGSLYLEDIGSRNGVFFNGRRIEKPIKVEPDGLYAIGNCLLAAALPAKGSGKASSRSHQLEFLNGDRAKQLIDIRPKPGSEDGAFTIGLDPACDINLPDMVVSRRHARLMVRSNGECWIADEGSQNGTYVNGQKLVGGKERLLKDGDKISIAYFDFRFLDRNVSHTHVPVLAMLMVLLVTGGALAVGYKIWNERRPSAGDYRKLATSSAEAEQFDTALAYMDQAVMARNAAEEKIQNDALRGQIVQWQETFRKWQEIRAAFENGRLLTSRRGLDNLLSESYAWSWNKTTAPTMRNEAEFAHALMRMCTDMSELFDRSEKTIVDTAVLADCIGRTDGYLKKNAGVIGSRPYLSQLVKLLKDYRDKLSTITDGINRINEALNGISANETDFSSLVDTFQNVASDVKLPSGVRNHAGSLIPICKVFVETQRFLDAEKTKVTDMALDEVRSGENAMPLPDKDSCARHVKFSDVRADFQKRHQGYQNEAMILGPMLRNLEAAGIRNGERGHLLTFVSNPKTWEAALSFDCFRNRFPLPSRVDPTGVYDELVGIESTYENLRELPKPPGRKTAVLMNFVPKCQTAKAAFDQVRTFLAFMDRPEGKEFRAGKLGRLYALGAQILADRDKLVAMLKQQAKAGTADRAKIVAGYYAEYFSDEPSYADLRSLEMAFRKLQKQINELNENYDSETDPEKQLKLRKIILDKGIPGMEAVRQRWVEVDAE